MAKHYTGYSQVDLKGINTDIIIDEQTLHEVYLEPFRAAVLEGDVGAIMCSYNMVNGSYMSQNEYLLKTVLRDYWRFKGFVMSDWGAVHAFSADKGMDMEMPIGAYNSTERLKLALKYQRITIEEINSIVRRILFTMGKMGYLERKENRQELGKKAIALENTYEKSIKEGLFEKNAEIAHEVAYKGAVLLKNKNMALPIKEDEIVAMIGLGAMQLMAGQEQERAFGRIDRMQSPYEAMRELAKYPENIKGTVGIDIIGKTIPENALYTDSSCTKHGVTRMYGINKKDGDDLNSFFKLLAKNVEKEMEKGDKKTTAISEAEILDMPVPMEIPVPVMEDTIMQGHELGSIYGIDKNIEFIACDHANEMNKTYKNDSNGNAFEKGSAYTWKGVLEAPEDGEYELVLQAIGGIAIFKIEIDGEMIQIGSTEIREGAQWPWSHVIPGKGGLDLKSKKVMLKKGMRYPIIVTGKALLEEKDLQLRISWITPAMRIKEYKKAALLASEADKVVLFLWGRAGCEGNQFLGERKLDSLCISAEQKKLLDDVTKTVKENHHKLIIVLNNGTIFTIGEWEQKVDAILNMWNPGQEGGRATAELLLGIQNPSGKLPQTMPYYDTETPFTDTEEHRMQRHDEKENLEYTDGILFGYRWYEKNKVKPLYCFGHGLSYTAFRYELERIEQKNKGAEVIGFDVHLYIENIGSVKGDEIVQLYLGKAEVPEHVQMADKQLAGFSRVEALMPSEKRKVCIHVGERMLSYWNPQGELRSMQDGTLGKWEIASGKRRLYIGASIEDIRITEEIDVITKSVWMKSLLNSRT